MNIRDLLNSIVDFEEHVGGIKEAIDSIDPKLDSREVLSLINDSKQADSNSVFIALKGTSVDSHQFINEAKQRNVICTIGEKDCGNYNPDLEVQNTRALLGPLSAALYNFPSTNQKLAGVTGTNGKTTVSYLYTTMVRAHDKHCFTMGTTGILFDAEKESDSQTTPDPLLLQKTLAEFLERKTYNGVLEVSSHALDQLRVLGTHFEVAGFTNLSQDHLDYHNSIEEYIESKLKLFSRDYTTKAVINLDGGYCDMFLKRCKENELETLSVSCEIQDSDLFIEVLDTDLSGSKIRVNQNIDSTLVDSFEVQTPLIGDFNYENIAVALGMATQAGFSLEASVNSLQNPLSVPGRLERRTSSKGFEVFVDYAHTPDAIHRALKVIKPLAKRLIVVFGAGGDRDSTKRPLMGRAASSLADYIIVTSDNPRSENPKKIIDEIVAGIDVKFEIEQDRRTAIDKALHLAEKGDVVLVAGKGHERGQIFANRVEDFSDIDVVEQLMLKKESS